MRRGLRQLQYCCHLTRVITQRCNKAEDRQEVPESGAKTETHSRFPVTQVNALTINLLFLLALWPASTLAAWCSWRINEEMMGSCPTADPWSHTELLAVFDESHEVGGWKRCWVRSSGSNVLEHFQETSRSGRMLYLFFFSGFLHSREQTNDMINILLKYTVSLEVEWFWGFFLREAGQRPGLH